MGAGDGFVIGLSKVLDHGPASERWNLVLVAEGFRAAEMPKFHNEVSKFIDKLFSYKPFDEMWCGINIYRLDVASDESGADEPGGGDCTGANVFRDTYFDATFCSSGIQRLLTVDSGLALATVAAELPEYDEVIMVVNSDVYGGAGGAVGTYSLGVSPVSGKGGVEIAIHELGHSGFNLADEYDYDNFGVYGGAEPGEVNVTANDDKNTIKWGDLIDGPTAVPTQSNPDCSMPNPNPSPVADGTVGAFEGARYWPCGMYRPEFTCNMRQLAVPFCAVCERRIRQVLEPYTLPVTATLATPNIDFQDIPEGVGGIGVTTYRAIVFEVGSCDPLSLQVTSGPTGGFGLPLGGAVVVNPGGPLNQGKIWISYTSTNAGDVANGTVTVESAEAAESWEIPITANTVARPQSAAALVLDRSGSMGQDAGDGTPKISKLRQAVKTFVEVMQAGDGLGLVRFNHQSNIVEPVADVAVNGGTIQTIIDGADFDPDGATSIGAGLEQGTDALVNAGAGYDVKAMVVLTDGKENRAPWIDDVSGLITANTFGIGFGTPANVDVGKLEILTGTHEGYLLLTGELTPGDLFRLQKYFLQILAGVSNAEIILDPGGILSPGHEHRIPFPVTDADYGLDVILLAPDPRAIDFQLELPSGKVVDPVVAAGEPNVQFFSSPNVAFYRLGLPALPPDSGASHGGPWNAVLRLGQKGTADGSDHRSRMPYTVLVHSYSSLRFKAGLSQSGFDPGSTLMLTATLSEYDKSVESGATVWAEMTRPDGTSKTLTFSADEPGRFTAQTTETSVGLYRFRVRASGTASRERPFTREQTVTAYLGRTGGGDGSGGSSDLCRLIECMARSGSTDGREGCIDWKALAECCQEHKGRQQ